MNSTNLLDQFAGVAAILILIEAVAGLLWVWLRIKSNPRGSLWSAIPWAIWFAATAAAIFGLWATISIAASAGPDVLPLVVPFTVIYFWVRHYFFPSPNWGTTWRQFWSWPRKKKA